MTSHPVPHGKLHAGGPEHDAPARLVLAPRDHPDRRKPKPLGIADDGTRQVLIGLKVPDARHHLHVLGPTGTGKSTFLVNHVIAEARAGRGVAVIDPKGDLTRDLLDRLPASVGRRLVLIDPDETQAPAAFNLLRLARDPEDTADQLVGVMARVWAQYWGPRTDDLARHAILTLVHLPGATLADLPRLLVDPVLRKRAMRHVAKADTVYRSGLEGFWASWQAQTPGETARIAGPLLSKLRAVLSRRFAAQLYGTPVSTFTLPDILDGGILLVRLPKLMGADTVRLTGSLLVAALLHAAAGRARLPEHQRLDATLVVDEAHNFVNLPIGIDDALAEMRALRLSVVLAHQHLGQLSTATFEGIDANARNKIFFQLAPGDARTLRHHVEPWFDPHDLTRRDPWGIVARIVINGREADPFTLTTRPAPPAMPGRAELLREAARAHGLSTAERDRLAELRRVGPSADAFATFTQEPHP
jgi:Type IV secretion-system coupling protein DNA-binding domain